jgi:Ser/Thr protein kinase RdoA (MazF antagonist)
MDGTLVDCDWPPLTLEELRPLLAEFPEGGAPVRILSVSPRPFSAASVVETTMGRVFVKRHPLAVRTAAGLSEEHRFLQHLRTHGAPVARVLTTASGATAIEQDEWTFEVHEVPSGVDIYEQAISWTPFVSASHARAAGAALARLHLASEGYTAPPRQAQPLVSSFSIFAAGDPQAALTRYLAARPALDANPSVRCCALEALELLTPFAAELRPLLPALPSLWTHNDLHASNLFWSSSSGDAEVTAIIDFGLSDRTFAVNDIAQAIERNIVEWLELVAHPERPEAVPVHYDHLAALLDGYTAVHPLTCEEALALAPTMALCHAEFALTEADYYLAALHSDERARVAYDDYLIGHAQWFLGAGAKLLDVLRSWATRYADAKENSK